MAQPCQGPPSRYLAAEAGGGQLNPLDDIRIVAVHSSRAEFVRAHPNPALVLRQVVEGDLQFASPGELFAEPRDGDTLIHVPRVTAQQRVHGPQLPGRKAIPVEMWFPLEPVPGKDGLILGRGPRADLSIADYTVSEAHAIVRFVEGTSRAWVADLGSRNGTGHNGVRLAEDQQVELVSGDEVVIGRHVLLFLDAADLYRYVTGKW